MIASFDLWASSDTLVNPSGILSIIISLLVLFFIYDEKMSLYIATKTIGGRCGARM